MLMDAVITDRSACGELGRADRESDRGRSHTRGESRTNPVVTDRHSDVEAIVASAAAVIV